jgi:hydroxymethylpyrimidine pyrophosphatase-like HAD family hydrolase
MRFAALATDYDGTLAHRGIVDNDILKGVARVRESGRRLLLVTGRRLDDLFNTFNGVDTFDLVVAENGALLYDPVTKREETIAQAPPPDFVAALTEAGVRPLDCGRVIVATLENHKEAIIDTIARMGLELQMIFNKGALMILPAGVTKATGLDAALKYAEAALTPDRSFYFRGPENKLNLGASNLINFVQIMEGVDGDTFSYHFGRHEYSQGFRENIKNPELADATGDIENGGLEVEEAKAALKRAIDERYTLPA